MEDFTLGQSSRVSGKSPEQCEVDDDKYHLQGCDCWVESSKSPRLAHQKLTLPQQS